VYIDTTGKNLVRSQCLQQHGHHASTVGPAKPITTLRHTKKDQHISSGRTRVYGGWTWTVAEIFRDHSTRAQIDVYTVRVDETEERPSAGP
jgi:hypothetical protein